MPQRLLAPCLCLGLLLALLWELQAAPRTIDICSENEASDQQDSSDCLLTPLEGDMLATSFVPSEQVTILDRVAHSSRRKHRSMSSTPKLWPNATVFYKFLSIDRIGQAIVYEALRNIQRNTCVKFERVESNRRDSRQFGTPAGGNVHFTRIIGVDGGKGCSSAVGKVKQSHQAITLEPSCVRNTGVIQHEIMHTLGFHHEQGRSDRDQYVDINWDNIASEHEDQFRIYGTSKSNLEQRFPFGLESLMLYAEGSFAIRPYQPTISPKGIAMGALPTVQTLSVMDFEKINVLYNCPHADYSVCGVLEEDSGLKHVVYALYTGEDARLPKDDMRFRSATVYSGWEIQIGTAGDHKVLTYGRTTLDFKLRTKITSLACYPQSSPRTTTTTTEPTPTPAYTEKPRRHRYPNDRYSYQSAFHAMVPDTDGARDSKVLQAVTNIIRPGHADWECRWKCSAWWSCKIISRSCTDPPARCDCDGVTAGH